MIEILKLDVQKDVFLHDAMFNFLITPYIENESEQHLI